MLCIDDIYYHRLTIHTQFTHHWCLTQSHFLFFLSFFVSISFRCLLTAPCYSFSLITMREHTHLIKKSTWFKSMLYFLFAFFCLFAEEYTNAFQYQVEYKAEAAECVWVWACILLYSKVNAIKIWSLQNAILNLKWACFVNLCLLVCVCDSVICVNFNMCVFFPLTGSFACLVLLLLQLVVVVAIIFQSFTNRLCLAFYQWKYEIIETLSVLFTRIRIKSE